MKPSSQAVIVSLAIALLNVLQADASNITIGPDGILSEGLSLPNGNPLTGSGIGIGRSKGSVLVIRRNQMVRLSTPMPTCLTISSIHNRFSMHNSMIS
jgi:hypothetical protein